MDQIITPIRNSPLLYKWLMHKQPYHSNIGVVTNVEYDGEKILIHVRTKPTELNRNKSVRVVISDDYGIPVVEEDVVIHKNKFKIGIRR